MTDKSSPFLLLQLLQCSPALQCTVLYFTVLQCTVLYFTVLQCTVLFFTVLQCTVLYFTVLQCTVLYFTVLQCTVLYFTVLQCTILYCIALYCSAQETIHTISQARITDFLFTHMLSPPPLILSKPPSYWRHRTSQRTQIEAQIPKKSTVSCIT